MQKDFKLVKGKGFILFYSYTLLKKKRVREDKWFR